MPIPRNRPQFKAAVTQAEVPPPIERPLSYVRTATVKSLLWRHYALLVLCVGWLLLGLACLAIALAAFTMTIPNVSADRASLLGAGGLFVGMLLLATGLGCWLRARWGRVCAFVVAVLWIITFPFGTILGIFTLVVLFGSAQLFGRNRFSGPELAEEHRYRKKRNKAT